MFHIPQFVCLVTIVEDLLGCGETNGPQIPLVYYKRTGHCYRRFNEGDFREREHVTPILILAVIVFFFLRTAIYRTFRNILMAEFEVYSKY